MTGIAGSGEERARTSVAMSFRRMIDPQSNPPVIVPGENRRSVTVTGARSLHETLAVATPRDAASLRMRS